MHKDTAEILLPHLPAIVDELVALFESRRVQWIEERPHEEIVRFAASSMECILGCMAAGSPNALERYMTELLRQGLNPAAAISDVVEGILLGKTALVSALRRTSGDAETLLDRLEALDAFYIEVLALITERYNAYVIADREREHARAKLLLEVSRAVTSDLAPDAVLERLARILSDSVGGGCCSIFLLNPETGGLTPQAGWGYGSEACMEAVRGTRLCTSGSELEANDGNTYGVCALSRSATAFAEILPEALRAGRTRIFPITSGKKTVGVAVLSSDRENFTFDENATSLVAGILNGVSVAIESAASAKHTQRKLKESEGLRRIANQLLSRPDADQESVLRLICDEARQIVGGTGSAILLRDRDHLRYACGTGTPQPPIQAFPLNGSRYGEIFLDGKTTIITDAQAGIPEGQRSKEVRTLIVVPLVEGEVCVGLILVSNKKSGFDLEDKNIMEMFAAQAVLALRNARLAEQSEMIVVAGERQRLARELHDSVTQALYAANLCAEAASRSVRAGKHDAAAKQLDALRGMTRQAMRDMRSLIFDLHPPELEREGLVGALRSRLNAVEGRSGIIPDLRVTGNERRLPLMVEEELFRIAIEALNNAAKHSRASQIVVALDYCEEGVTLTVSDNGVGCDMDSLPSGGMGLRGMRERAQRISGHMHITGRPGEGCSVGVAVSFTSGGDN